MNTKKLGGWMLVLAISKWICIVSVALMTIGIVTTYAGMGQDGELFWILVCGLVYCAAQFVQFRMLKSRIYLQEPITDTGDLVVKFLFMEGVSCIAMCIFMDKYMGTWISMLLSELVYGAVWGFYLYKSKRVDEYFF